MSNIAKMWAGSGYNKDVRLIKRVYDDGRVSYEFRDRKGYPANPTASEAQEIINRWNLEEVEV